MKEDLGVGRMTCGDEVGDPISSEIKGILQVREGEL
jgi:hypothetical protein